MDCMVETKTELKEEYILDKLDIILLRGHDR